MRKIALPLVLSLLAACSDPVGNHYRDVDALAIATEWRDWVVVGTFGPDGPFELTNMAHCEANVPCSFAHAGQGHTYDGFDDFEMMVLRLESPDGDVSHVVLRGRDKRN